MVPTFTGHTLHGILLTRWKWIMLCLFSFVNTILCPLIFTLLFVLRSCTKRTTQGLGPASKG